MQRLLLLLLLLLLVVVVVVVVGVVVISKGPRGLKCTSESQSKYVMTPSLTFIIAVILHGNPVGSMCHPLHTENPIEHDANIAFSPYFTWLSFQ